MKTALVVVLLVTLAGICLWGVLRHYTNRDNAIDSDNFGDRE